MNPYARFPYAPQQFYYAAPMPPPGWAPQQYAQPRVMTSRVAGDADLIAGGDYDLIGADPDAEALLAGFDMSQIAGAEEITGFDMSAVGAEDIDVGAARPRFSAAMIQRNPMAFAAQQVRRAKALQAQPVIVDKPYVKTRKLPLGVDSGVEVTAGNTAVISVTPNAPFKAQYFLVADDVAPDFVITALQFGRTNGLAGAGEVPATTYQESGDGRLNEFDVPATPPGIPIQVTVRNISGANRRFRARFQGSILES